MESSNLTTYSGLIRVEAMYVIDNTPGHMGIILGPKAVVEQIPRVTPIETQIDRIFVILQRLPQPYGPVDTRTVGAAIVSDYNARKQLKIPRPPNSFILFRKDNHAKMVEANPGLHNTKICE